MSKGIIRITAIAFNPLRVKQSSDIVHRYDGAADQKRRQPKTSDERIALRGSLTLCIRGITHVSRTGRVHHPSSLSRDTSVPSLSRACIPLLPPGPASPHSRSLAGVPVSPLEICSPSVSPLTRPRIDASSAARSQSILMTYQFIGTM